MKKYFLVGLITSVIMIGIMGGSIFFLSKAQKTNQDSSQMASFDLPVPEAEKEKPDKEKAIELKWKGNNKNVFTYASNKINNIYNAKKSAAIQEKIEKQKQKGEYTIEEPLWVKNPFGTNDLAFYLYFKTPEEVKLEYTIYVQEEKIPNFTRTPYNSEISNFTREHEYQITGLVPGKDNYIILKLYNKKGKKLVTKTYKVSMEKLDSNIPTTLSTTKGLSTEPISKGLFFLFGRNGGDKNAPKSIQAYDNSGVLRVNIPLQDYRSDRMEFILDTMYYAYDKDKIAAVSSLGQVLKTYDLGKYEQHHDFVYNGYGQLWMLATDTSKKNKAVKDVLISLDIETGKVKELIDFQTMFPQAFAAAKKKSDGKTINWIELDSIEMTAGNDIIVSSRKLSSIIKIKNVNTKFPSIDYIIADEKIWKKYKQSDLLLTKVNEEGKTKEEVKAEEEPLIDSILPDTSEPEEVFESQSGQHTVTYEMSDGLSEGQYYLLMFNNNINGTKENKKSKYYKYLVDEVNRTYTLVEEFDIEYSNNTGSVQKVEDNILINSGKADVFGEYDKNGESIYEYDCPVDTYTYRIFKYDMKQFWFY